MALKHLLNAVELLRAGMPMADIRAIVSMEDTPAQDQQETEEENNETSETNADQGAVANDAPEENTEQTDTPEPEEKNTNPLQRPEVNQNSGDQLIEQLNKLF